MFDIIGRIVNSISRLSGSVDALADTLDAINAGVRQRVGMTSEVPPATVAIEDKTEGEERKSRKK